jgi:uncharacterized repeat protein (TIGR03803 family)
MRARRLIYAIPLALGCSLLGAAPALIPSAFTPLYQFSGSPDGNGPYAGVSLDQFGNIFGTTALGGAYGCGTVFKLTPSGSAYAERVAHSFRNAHDGCNPFDSPFEGRDGRLIVTVQEGGRYPYGGTAVELSPSGNSYVETAEYAFGNGRDGRSPSAPFTRPGNELFTTTSQGGRYGYGTIVAFQPGLVGERVLLDFHLTTGSDLSGGLAADAKGVLYGTAFDGGANNDGTVFKFVPHRSGGTLTVLWNFDGADGANPSENLLIDGDGAIYGTTQSGTGGAGVVFKLTPHSGGYTETVLHQFSTFSDGLFPTGLVALGQDLYGTTFDGGMSGCQSDGCGVIFKVSSSGGDFAVLHTFSGSDDGANPAGTLATDGHALYGATVEGGASGDGVVFRYIP